MIFSALAACLCMGSQVQGGLYTIAIARPGAPSAFMEPLILTNKGDMAGIFSIGTQVEPTPFLKIGNGPILGLPVAGTGPGGRIYAMNKHGVVVGAYLKQMHDPSVGYIATKKDGVKILDFRPRSINDSGEIVGTKTLANQHSVAILYKKGKEIALQPLAGYSDSLALCINEQGDIVGYSTSHSKDNEPGNGNVATVWDRAGRPRKIAAPAGYSEVLASQINGKGTVALLCGNRENRGSAVYLVRLDGTGLKQVQSAANGVSLSVTRLNERDEVVGLAVGINDATEFGWLYRDGKTYDLRELLSRENKITPTAPYWINDKSQIVGLAMTASSEYVGFVMTPRKQ